MPTHRRESQSDESARRAPRSEGRVYRGRSGAPPHAQRVAGPVRPWRTRAAATCLAVLAACSTVPITGRKAFNLIPESSDPGLGAQAYAGVLQEAKLADNHPQAPLVKRVTDRLVPQAQELIGVPFDWEVHVIQDDATANAWCMPGGKMAVYTGILPLTQDESGLAVVMGHEIGHAVARHGAERMTQQLGVEVVLAFIQGQYAELAGTATNLLVLLPFSRKHELEADRIGLILMARAGYDPRTAVAFWQRMAAASGGAPPEILSTHPSDAHRIAQIEQLLPEALAQYHGPKGFGP